MCHPPTVIGLGETLWDVFSSGRRLGGAPANFAYCCHLLGDIAIIASRTGNDELGRELRQLLVGAGLTDRGLQEDSAQPTGTVQVQVGATGQPSFRILEPVAWDFLEWNESWEALAHSADAVCFGTLAQRSPISRATILKFLDTTPDQALRVFDVNLRQSFYSAEIVRLSLKRANVLKLNHEELPLLADMLQIDATSQPSFCRQLLQRFDLRLVCVTQGSNGSLLADKNGVDEHPRFRAEIVDTVGAGDAFTAGLVHELLRGSALSVMNDTANRMGAWVASHAGAMPAVPAGGLDIVLAKLVRNDSTTASLGKLK
jgi:fructokinase